jgi:hypothetical protein
VLRDEKSQCQPLERTQLALALAPKRPRTMTHDYTRHGTVTLFAALNVLEGKFISRTEARDTHIECLRFLKQIDRETPKDLDLHLIADNYATHRHPRVKIWLKRHPRFIFVLAQLSAPSPIAGIDTAWRLATHADDCRRLVNEPELTSQRPSRNSYVPTRHAA